MIRCIFCNDNAKSFTTREHILPESLGGGDWAILPDGLYCDGCQNRFGSEIEQQALGDYPFSFFRVFLGIPTKKGKAPWFKSFEGTVRASPQFGAFGFDPDSRFERATIEGTKTQMRLLAHPLKPEMVCRFLLKMGIEVVAADDLDAVHLEKFDASRNYALTGKKVRPWWYLQCERMDEASRFMTEGVSESEWRDGIQLEVVKLEKEQEMFHLKLLYIDMFVPLTTSIEPQLNELNTPEFRIFHV